MVKGNPPVAAAGKAQQFATDAKEAGWEVAYEYSDEIAGREVVISTKGKSDNYTSLTLVWDNNRYNYNESAYLSDGHTRTVRNASEARRILTGELKPQPGNPIGKQVRKKEAIGKESNTKQKPVPFKSTPKPKTILPFDLLEASDEEILQAVVGKRITWKNKLSGNYDEARVLANPRQRHLRIDRNGRNERCLTFAEADPTDPRIPGGGFRSVRINAITAITAK